MIWCNEKVVLIHDVDYEMDYIIMYVFLKRQENFGVEGIYDE
jgi:hypothetical protein